MSGARYCLAEGAQVREEQFGLLFYTMEGPRLFFLSSGTLLGTAFFDGNATLSTWLGRRPGKENAETQLCTLESQLKRLVEKGVIVEC